MSEAAVLLRPAEPCELRFGVQEMQREARVLRYVGWSTLAASKSVSIRGALFVGAIFLFVALFILGGCARVSTSRKDVFGDYTWEGKAPDGKSDLLLVASLDEDFGSMRLTGFRLDYPGGSTAPKKAFETTVPGGSCLVKLSVYPCASRHVLYAAVRWAGAGDGADWVVRIDGIGRATSIYHDFNRGNPAFRLRDGHAELVEVWDIAGLMATGWQAPRAFDDHVLVKRVYRLDDEGGLTLQGTRPAVVEERKLSEDCYQSLLKARRDHDSNNSNGK